jgi:hypothetical protein
MTEERKRECREVFDKTFQRILRVRMFSSPTAKIEYISKFLDSLMPDDGLQEADFVVSLMILAFAYLGKKSADMYLEIKYIKAFSLEDLYDKVDSCQCLAYIETALEKVMTGIDHHLSDKQQGVSSSNQSSSRKRSDDCISQQDSSSHHSDKKSSAAVAAPKGGHSGAGVWESGRRRTRTCNTSDNKKSSDNYLRNIQLLDVEFEEKEAAAPLHTTPFELPLIDIPGSSLEHGHEEVDTNEPLN